MKVGEGEQPSFGVRGPVELFEAIFEVNRAEIRRDDGEKLGFVYEFVSQNLKYLNRRAEPENVLLLQLTPPNSEVLS